MDDQDPSLEPQRAGKYSKPPRKDFIDEPPIFKRPRIPRKQKSMEKLKMEKKAAIERSFTQLFSEERNLTD